MKTKIILTAAIFAAMISSAQTNEPVVQVKFYSDPNATNEITFLNKGKVQGIRGVVKGTFPKSGRILLATMNPVIGDFGIVEGWQESDKEIVVANYPALEILTTGREIIFDARKIGTIRGLKSDGTASISVLELWEYYTPPLPTPEEIAAAKAAQEKARAETKAKAAEKKKVAEARALQSNQDAAAHGDSFGLMRMGERYRDGDGVEKNLSKAREYLQKSVDADAGNFIAKEELSKLHSQ
jgi:hypothetical protein